MILINGIYWKIARVSPDFPLLRRRSGAYSVGACDNLTRTIYLSETLSGSFLKKVLCHEITHAAMFSYNVNLSVDQEQLVADLISTYGDEIVYITNKIFTKLKNFQ